MKLYAREYHGSDDPWTYATARELELREMLYLLLNYMETIMAAIDDLAAAVAAEDTTIDSAVVLLNGIPALIAAAGTDPAALKKLQDDITAKTATLAAAVVTGTPTPAPGAAPVSAATAATQAAAAV